MDSDPSHSGIQGRRWVDDLIQYFRELGGEAHYSDLYQYIAENPRRNLGREWQAVVRRTIEEHSSDTSIWEKRRLPDLFRSVDGIGRGRWALRAESSAESAMAWQLKPTDTISRAELVRLYGGANQGGICPSAKTPNIFLFTDPEGREHGYIFDGWRDDGCFYYTGSGLRGDQVLRGVNKSVLEHAERGKTLRLFQGNRGNVKYQGPFVLDGSPPYYRDDAPETGGGPLRSVIVFRLRPAPDMVVSSEEPALNAALKVDDVPVEESHEDKYVLQPAATSIEAERREAKLVKAFCNFLKARKLTPIGKKIRPPGHLSRIAVDIFIRELNILIEAKGTIERDAFRLAIGQLADYRRFLESPQCAILLPIKPSQDLLELAKAERLAVIWATDRGFASEPALF